jgi:hypothetical protein
MINVVASHTSAAPQCRTNQFFSELLIISPMASTSRRFFAALTDEGVVRRRKR